MDKKVKTNAIRLLDKMKIDYILREYTPDRSLSAVDVANALDLDENQVFKTLVTTGKTGEHYVFVIPGNKSLDLKKAAAAVGEKSVSMLKEKDLLPLTGYVHGGCSPIGMKKFFKTTIDESCKNFENIIISAGKLGLQVELPLKDLASVIEFTTDYVTTE